MARESDMARPYATLLGWIAFLTLVLRGVLAEGEITTVVIRAWIGLMVFAFVGFFLGWIAQQIVDWSVKSELERETSVKPTAS